MSVGWLTTSYFNYYDRGVFIAEVGISIRSSVVPPFVAAPPPI
jgi:hypothetical protein